jgi:hypothetical protein
VIFSYLYVSLAIFDLCTYRLSINKANGLPSYYLDKFSRNSTNSSVLIDLLLIRYDSNPLSKLIPATIAYDLNLSFYSETEILV